MFFVSFSVVCLMWHQAALIVQIYKNVVIRANK